MPDRFMLTPFFLADPLPGLAAIAPPDWYPNVPSLPEGDLATRLRPIHAALAEAVADTLRSGHRPVSLAGDCVTTLGVLAGLQRSGLAPTLLWLDAHGDLNTPETSPSGFLGGMPLAMLIGRGDLSLLEAAGAEPLAEERVVLAGARDLDPGERELLAGSAVRHVEELDEALDDLPEGPLWVHFDTDVVDPEEVPAHHYPAPGGPSAATVAKVFRRLARQRPPAAVSVSMWDPRLEGSERSQRIVMRLLRVLLSD